MDKSRDGAPVRAPGARLTLEKYPRCEMAYVSTLQPPAAPNAPRTDVGWVVR